LSNLIERLPLEASLDIFSYLRRSDLDSCFRTCSGWRKIANSDELRSLWEIYSPREFAKQFRSEKCFYSRKGSQQIGDMYDEGFNKFISVITDFGIVSGKLTNFSENFYLKIFFPIVQKTEYYWMLEQKIPLEKINSIRVLNRHFPYKFAYDWHYTRSEFPKFCLVVIKTHVKTISGRLIPKMIQKLVFGCVGYAAHFLSSLAPCACTMVARSRQKICAAALPNSQLLNHFRYTF
jgi:hypothetical protein